MIGVVTYGVGSHKAVAILTILGTLRMFSDMLSNFNAWYLVELIFAGALIFLGFYLDKKLSPDFKIVKERYQNVHGQDRLRNRIKFEDE